MTTLRCRPARSRRHLAGLVERLGAATGACADERHAGALRDAANTIRALNSLSSHVMDTLAYPHDQRALTERLERERGEIIPWVFHRDGAPIVSFYGSWRAACRLAGCPGRLLHDFGAPPCAISCGAGVPESIAMKITGHKTRSVFDRDDITSEEDRREAVRLLSAHLAAGNGKIVGKAA